VAAPPVSRPSLPRAPVECRPVRRRLLNLLTLVSLLLFVAVAVLWVVSMFRGLAVEYWAPACARTWGISCSRGEIGLSRSTGAPVSGVAGGLRFYSQRPVSPIDSLRTLVGPIAGFQFNVLGVAKFQARPGTTILDLFYFPCWLALALTAVLPVRRHLLARRRDRVGHCVNCGYDLRATPDRCPECGTMPQADPAL
jgi:hypothetical protein